MNIRRGTVVFDIDGVLADFEQAWCREFGNQNRHLYKMEERLEGNPLRIKESLEFIRDPNIYYGLEPIVGGINFLKSFIERNYYVIVATSRPKVARTVTQRWLTNQGVPYMKLYFVDKKAEELNTIGQTSSYLKADILVDDNPEILDDCAQYFISPICWKQPWNEYWFPKVWAIDDGKFAFQQYNETNEIESYWKD